MKKRPKSKPGRKPLPGGRAKFTTTLPPQTISDLNTLAIEDTSSSAQVIVRLVKAEIDRRSDNQSGD